eukprot:CAMPEP_0196654408 /NCGR_PEP_ID=MMETSP1086-20130531/4103_1 /TAXON_ID=77921 /ORGANISM="Cyanoptyche  gloeocystis , Strain SAG4.97" /LENGTH=142 /DNA_ID=CAMNT_0041986139 /DNA_START=585 /DNA_END=1013 /DNA_ORIENTATION=-
MEQRFLGIQTKDCRSRKMRPWFSNAIPDLEQQFLNDSLVPRQKFAEFEKRFLGTQTAFLIWNNDSSIPKREFANSNDSSVAKECPELEQRFLGFLTEIPELELRFLGTWLNLLNSLRHLSPMPSQLSSMLNPECNRRDYMRR